MYLVKYFILEIKFRFFCVVFCNSLSSFWDFKFVFFLLVMVKLWILDINWDRNVLYMLYDSDCVK